MHDRLRRRWAANMKAARKAAGLSQFDAGEAIGVDQTTISRWERGKSIPTETSKIAMGQVYGVEAVRDMFPLWLEDSTPTAGVA